MRNPLAFREAMMAHHDVARGYFFGAGDIYNLCHPDHIKRFLLTDHDSFGKSEDIRKDFGEGLVATEGDQWKKARSGRATSSITGAKSMIPTLRPASLWFAMGARVCAGRWPEGERPIQAHTPPDQ